MSLSLRRSSQIDEDFGYIRRPSRDSPAFNEKFELSFTVNITKLVTMDKKPTVTDSQRDDDLNDPASDQSVATDFTLVASCILPDNSEEAGNRKIKSDQVREYIAAEKNRPLSIRQKLLNRLGLK